MGLCLWSRHTQAIAAKLHGVTKLGGWQSLDLINSPVLSALRESRSRKIGSKGLETKSFFFVTSVRALCSKTLRPCRTRPAYCFAAVNWLLVPCNLSSILAVMTLPSAATVMRATLITFPSRLSVSSIVFLLMLFTETLVIPGSPL